MMLPVAILAGGVASRLRPVSEKIPKALVKVAGRPFVFHQLEWLRAQGARTVVLCVGYLGEQIRQAVGDGRKFGLAIDYSFDGDRLLGTGGALRKAIGKAGQDFFVLHGDTYLTCSLRDVERGYFAAGKLALMTVLPNGGRWDRSNVLFQDGRILRYDKKKPTPDMQHIDYGLNVLSAAVFAPSAWAEAFDLSDLLTELSERGELSGYEVTERFYEIGSPEGLQETNQFLSARAGK